MVGISLLLVLRIKWWLVAPQLAEFAHNKIGLGIEWIDEFMVL